MDPDYRPNYERSLTLARKAVGEIAFAAAWAEGRAMTLEQAIEYALSEDISDPRW